MSMLFGERAAGWTVDLPFDGILAAVLPPGAFFGLAILLALRNLSIDRRAARTAARTERASDAPRDSHP
jgi:electron transport complex protein RnfE